MTTETPATADPAPAPASPPAPPTLGEVLAAARTKAQEDLAAAQARLAAVEARIASIPGAFHAFSWQTLTAEVEAWFTKL